MKLWLLGLQTLAVGDYPAVKWAVAALAGGVSYVTGDSEATGRVLAVTTAFILLDFMTGVCASWVRGEPIKSRIARRKVGLFIGYASGVAMAAMVREIPGVPPAVATSAVIGVASMVAFSEVVSICENVDRLGVKLPPWLVTGLRGRLAEAKKQQTEEL